MIEYKKSSDNPVERVQSANLEGSISLTWLWEIIVRTRRLPEGLDPKVLFSVLRDRLRNPEREVRQHALRVLADLIPVVDQEDLDQNMDFLLSELILNLSNVSPSIRKGCVDVLRVYLKHTREPNSVLKQLITSVPEKSNLMLGIIIAIPYLTNQTISEDSVIFLIHELFRATSHDSLRETAFASLVKTREKLGSERFNYLLQREHLSEKFKNLSDTYHIHLNGNNKDNVILETEFILNTGPAITMKIHEETTDKAREDEESIIRSPRKVHFGGEVVKMRTPESDSNQQSSDDNNEIQTSVLIDQNTSIKIMLGDNVTSVKTKHSSRIPVRISTRSTPGSPIGRKKVVPKKRLHKSAPELRNTSKIPLKRNRVKPPKRKKSLSPLPVHNEIEIFHNLTRSPVRSPEPEDVQYESFQVCEEEIKNENAPCPFDGIVRDLIYKDDNWTQIQALDNLTTILSDPNTNFQSKSITKDLFDALFACEKQTRLQTKAQEALRMVISRIDLQTLQEFLPQLGGKLANLSGPARVRLSLLAMERSSPKKFFENFQTTPFNQEASLQILIAAAKTFPSSEIDIVKGANLAFDALQDSKRCVRQAALEALASLAQVSGNTLVLNIITDLAKDLDNSEQLLRVVRTRLSRRQLPIVDLNGNIRYSSPREQEEFDWVCGGTCTLSKTLSLNSIKVPYSFSPNVASTSSNNNNYWKHNSRHDIPENNADNSCSNDGAARNNKETNWGGEDNTFQNVEKGALYPVYVLHRETPQVNGRSYRNYDRGRSNSPPRRKNVESQDSVDDFNGNRVNKKFLSKQTEQFKKSFSSEHLYSGNFKNVEPTSFSLSSRSSTTSTGSSTRSGLWLRSGIPVPITSESKIKFRTHRHSSDCSTGPLIAQESIKIRTKLESPQASPLVIIRSSPNIQENFTQQLVPPRSSGSESSGYFTPPAEHHIAKERPLEKCDSEESSFHRQDSEPIFQIVDSELEISDAPENDNRQSSGSSVERKVTTISSILRRSPEEDHRVEESLQKESPPELDEVDFQSFSELKSKSKSEVNLKSTLPEISERKNLNSAPPLNDLVNIVPYKFQETSGRTSLPGSVILTETTPVKTESRRLLRRSLSTRTSNKRILSSPRNPEVKTYTRPKELLNQILTQIESNDWELIIQGLNSLISLSSSHPDVIENQIHQICIDLAKNVKNLRSQVARAACHACTELFNCCKRNLDMELEELAGPLLHRTADTNKFLRSDANAALDAMSLNLSLPRVVAVISSKGATHHNCVVRAAATRLLSDIAMRLGPERIFQLPKETRDKFLLVGANGLTEGSLDTRKYAKNLMGILVKHQNFQKGLSDAVPQHTVRHITKVLNSLKQ